MTFVLRIAISLPKIPLGYKKVLHGVCDKQVSICSPPKSFFDPPIAQHRKQDHVMSRDSQLSQSDHWVVLSQFQRKDCVTEIMPINDNLGWPHTSNKPHNHKSRDARRVLLHS